MRPLTMRAEILSIGDELTSGQRLDTNSQWLAERLGAPVATTLMGNGLFRGDPFDLDIFDCENAVDGVQFCTIGRVRPVLQQADIVCSDGGGYTLVCDGRTFCGADSPDFLEQQAVARLTRVYKYPQLSYSSEPTAPDPPRQLTVTTLCTPDSATLVLTQ